MLAERVLGQRRLVGPLGREDLTEAIGLGFDAAPAGLREPPRQDLLRTPEVERRAPTEGNQSVCWRMRYIK
ncbi:hypothetical protein ACFCZV_00345 [Streptomyces hydrogenans]|uniref:hypothetical protein n=1 Tax=Streptomyces hydrogenans TaxID=1873719 RepID=UPI0035D6307E